LDPDEIEDVRDKIKTDPDMARHLAFAHAKNQVNVRDNTQI